MYLLDITICKIMVSSCSYYENTPFYLNGKPSFSVSWVGKTIFNRSAFDLAQIARRNAEELKLLINKFTYE